MKLEVNIRFLDLHRFVSTRPGYVLDTPAYSMWMHCAPSRNSCLAYNIAVCCILNTGLFFQCLDPGDRPCPGQFAYSLLDSSNGMQTLLLDQGTHCHKFPNNKLYRYVSFRSKGLLNDTFFRSRQALHSLNSQFLVEHLG